MKYIILLAGCLFSFLAVAKEEVNVCKSGYPWYMPKKGASDESAQHLQLNANSSVSLRVCYCEGEKDSYVMIRSLQKDPTLSRAFKSVLSQSDDDQKTKGNSIKVSRLYLSSCVIASGQQIWLGSENKFPVKGTFGVIP